jgi:hypothetical protein
MTGRPGEKTQKQKRSPAKIPALASSLLTARTHAHLLQSISSLVVKPRQSKEQHNSNKKHNHNNANNIKLNRGQL